jgi:hypothetical protein
MMVKSISEYPEYLRASLTVAAWLTVVKEAAAFATTARRPKVRERELSMMVKGD